MGLNFGVGSSHLLVVKKRVAGLYPQFVCSFFLLGSGINNNISSGKQIK